MKYQISYISYLTYRDYETYTDKTEALHRYSALSRCPHVTKLEMREI